MLRTIKALLKKTCAHEKVRVTERKLWERRCDCCNKVLLNKDDIEFKIVNNSELKQYLLNDNWSKNHEI